MKIKTIALNNFFNNVVVAFSVKSFLSFSWLVKLITLLCLILLLPLHWFLASAYFFTPSKAPRVALVFGAGVFCKESSFQSSESKLNSKEISIDCSPTSVLEKRLDTAVYLWKTDAIDTIIVSGDNRFANYNEPAGMFRYLKDAGVNPNNIVQDFAGFSTIDTCWRAKNVFNAQSVFVVTQAFHVPRASFLCRSVGLQVIPFASANSNYISTALWGVFREIPGSWAALFVAFNYNGALGSNGQEPRVE